MGFTGFISMPLVHAFPIGLPLVGTTTLILADNSKVDRLMALGFASIGGEPPQGGVIILETSQGDVLVGMEFLRRMKRTLTVAPLAGTVMLTDEVLAVAPAPAAVPDAPTPPKEPSATAEKPA